VKLRDTSRDMPSKLVNMLHSAYNSVICQTPQMLQSAYLSDNTCTFIATGLRVVWSGFQFRRRQGISLFFEKLRPILGTIQPRIQWAAVII